MYGSDSVQRIRIKKIERKAGIGELSWPFLKGEYK